MKYTSLLFAVLLSLSVSAQSIRVVSDQVVAQGFAPRLSENASTLYYLDNESSRYVDQHDASLYVSNENLNLYLHRGQECIQLTPAPADAHYIWCSLSPDKRMILFNTAYGTQICDLQGRVLHSLGQLDAPVWYGNGYVVGMHDESDGHYFTGSSLAIVDLSTGVETALTDRESFAMYPSVSAQTGKVAYETLRGDIHLMQLNLTDQPITNVLPEIMQAPKQLQRGPKKTVRTHWDSFADVKIYINPGHGGYTGNDRNMVIYPYAGGDTLGFWESTSNLDKGFRLRDLLNELGVQTMMSRTLNREIDDRALSAIVAEANDYDADFMLSIHSNAGSGLTNCVLMLYAGKDDNDTHSYPTATPVSNESRAISAIIADNLQKNTITTWSRSTPQVVGDKTFGRTAMGWSDGYGVLRRLTVPGVISEGSMHDYIPETYRLMNMDYKWKESWYFLKTFCHYFLNYDLTTGVIGGQVRDGSNKMSFPAITAIRNSRDKLEPINGAEVELLQNGSVLQTYTTDQLYNGVFFFWDLTPGTYTVRTKVNGYYLRTEDVVVEAGEITYQDLMLAMERQTRPEVVSYSPNVELTDSVEVRTPIVLEFNWDMWEEPTAAAFHISPEAAGTIEFSNSQHVLTFTPEGNLTPGVEYTVTLDTTACHPDTMFTNHLAEPFTFSFRTKNRSHLSIRQSFPENGQTDVPVQPTIMLVTDAPLSSSATTKCAQLFKLESADGTYSYTPTSRNFKRNTAPEPYGSARFELTAALQPSTTYKLTVSQDLADVNTVALGTDQVITFTTEAAIGSKPGTVIIPCDSVSFNVNTDKTLGLSSKKLIVDGTKLTEGAASNHLAYSFDAESVDAYVFLSPRDLSHEFTSADAIDVDLYGDLSGNDVYVEFSVEGDVHLLRLCSLDYAGWAMQRLELTDLPQGVSYQFTGIRIVRTDGILASVGDIFIDRIARELDVNPLTGIEEVNAQTAKKVLDEGHVFILDSDRVFDTQGRRIR